MVKKILLSLVLILLFSSLYAAEITINDAIESSKNNSISLAIAKEQFEQNLRSSQVLASYLPDIALTGSISTNGSLASGSFTPLNANINAGISWSIGTSYIGKNEEAIISRTLAELEYIQSTNSVELSAVSAYLSLLSADVNVKQAKKKVESLKTTLLNQREKYEKGQDSELTLLEAESQFKKAEYSLKTYQALYELSLQSFITLTGIDGDFTLISYDEIELLNLPSASELYSKHRDTITSLKIKDAQISESELSLQSTKRSVLSPSLELSTGYSAGASATYTSKLSSNVNDDFYIKVQFSIPISSYINGSSGDTKLKNAESEVTIAKLNKEKEVENTLSSILTLIQNLKNAEDSVNLASYSFILFEKTYELKKEAFEAGLISLSELISAEDNLFDASISLENEKINYLECLYQLSYELGISKEELIKLYGRNN